MLDIHNVEAITEEGLDYFLNKGQKFASVTTILKVVAKYKGLTFSGWKSQRRLSNWKLRIGEETADQIRFDACTRGIEFHERIANYLLGGKGTQWPQELLPFAYSIKPALLQVNPERDVKLVEGMVLHPKLHYAGKVDAIVKWRGTWSLIEWKTANIPKKREWIRSYLLQSAAYIAAANKTYNLALKQSLIVIAIPGREAQVFLVNWEELKSYFREWLSYVEFFWALKKSINIQTGEPLKLVKVIGSNGCKHIKLS